MFKIIVCVFMIKEKIDIGSIIHFFTIIGIEDNYYLNSSYGSDYVCVPQYISD